MYFLISSLRDVDIFFHTFTTVDKIGPFIHTPHMYIICFILFQVYTCAQVEMKKYACAQEWIKKSTWTQVPGIKSRTP